MRNTCSGVDVKIGEINTSYPKCMWIFEPEVLQSVLPSKLILSLPGQS